MAGATIRDDVVAIVHEVLQEEMRRFGLEQVEVSVRPDHDGDPSLHIDASYRKGAPPVDPKVMAGIVTKLRDRLWERGEVRFPYVRHHFPEDQRVVGFN